MDHFDPPQPYLPDSDPQGGEPVKPLFVLMGVLAVLAVTAGLTATALYFFAS